MVIILYDLNRLELVYPISSTILKFHRQDIKTMPASPSTIQSIVEEELQKHQNDYYFDEEAEIDPDFKENQNLKIIILGLGPRNYEENNDIYNLIESCGEKITLWVDNQVWPDNLLKYFTRKDINFFLDQSLSCLEILREFRYYVPKSWILAEKAIAKKNYKNKQANRCLKAFKIASIKGAMYDEKIDFQNMAMNLISDEILKKIGYEVIYDNAEKEIDQLANEYLPMKRKTSKLISRIKNEHPAFSRDKNYHGQVGLLQMGRISDLIDIEEIKKVISEGYPELWIVSYKFKGKNYIQANSCIPSLFYDIKSFLNDVTDINTEEFIYVMGSRYKRYLKSKKKIFHFNNVKVKKEATQK